MGDLGGAANELRCLGGFSCYLPTNFFSFLKKMGLTGIGRQGIAGPKGQLSGPMLVYARASHGGLSIKA